MHKDLDDAVDMHVTSIWVKTQPFEFVAVDKSINTVPFRTVLLYIDTTHCSTTAATRNTNNETP
jgi:hypothetical protein